MSSRRRYRWQGPQPTPGEEQIANAPDGLFPLAPASEAAAMQTRANWAALLSGQTVPLNWEESDGIEKLDQRLGRG